MIVVSDTSQLTKADLGEFRAIGPDGLGILKADLGLAKLTFILTLSYMRATLTVSLPPALRRHISRSARDQGLNESEFIRRAVQRQMWADAFDETRRKLLPKARAKRIYTDDDVFKMIS
jgi:hypothetical protein